MPTVGKANVPRAGPVIWKPADPILPSSSTPPPGRPKTTVALPRSFEPAYGDDTAASASPSPLTSPAAATSRPASSRGAAPRISSPGVVARSIGFGGSSGGGGAEVNGTAMLPRCIARAAIPTQRPAPAPPVRAGAEGAAGQLE